MLVRPRGCFVGFDLAHAAGNIPLHLHDWGVDFAVWCSYKYLNAGPGSIAGCFVHERHAYRPELPRFAGWWGHNKTTRFDMPAMFDPLPGAEGWQLSNPPILPLAALRASMDIFTEVGMPQLRSKSEALTGWLETLLAHHAPANVTVITPPQPAQRGAQFSLLIPQHGKALHARLVQANIMCDWREPDVIRVAPVPLYNSFMDVYTFVDILVAANRELLGSGGRGSMSPQTITLIGAGLAGSLLAIFLARRGFHVDLYERRPDMRQVEMSAGRSINLAMSTRGIHALQQVGLYDTVQALAIPMRGRVIHPLDGALAFQPYGQDDTQVLHAISRADLNTALINAADSPPRSTPFLCRTVP